MLREGSSLLWRRRPSSFLSAAHCQMSRLWSEILTGLLRGDREGLGYSRFDWRLEGRGHGMIGKRAGYARTLKDELLACYIS